MMVNATRQSKCNDCDKELVTSKYTPPIKCLCGDCKKARKRITRRNNYNNNIKGNSERQVARTRAQIARSERNKINHNKRLFSSSRHGARMRNLEFSITPDDIFVPDVCPVLKTEFVYGTMYTMSLDRIDNSKGYIPGNIQVISKMANQMKNSATSEELIAFADWVYKEYKG